LEDQFHGEVRQEGEQERTVQQRVSQEINWGLKKKMSRENSEQERVHNTIPYLSSNQENESDYNVEHSSNGREGP
jgi:hypothetical protein